MEVRIISRPHPDDDLGFVISKQTSSEEAIKLAVARKIKLRNKHVTLDLVFEVNLSQDKKTLIAEVATQTMSDRNGPLHIKSYKRLLMLLFKGHGWTPM